MRLQRQIDTLQAQRASEWFELLKQGRAEDMAAFQEWCRKSPLHIQEFLEITWTDRALSSLDAERQIDLDALVREIRPDTFVRRLAADAPGVLRTTAGLASDVQAARGATGDNAPASAGTRARWLSRRSWALAAALGILAVGLAACWQLSRPPQEFSTRVGELRTVELTDASVVTLNTNSDIHVEFARGERNIELRRGEAVFRVAHDPARPFRVHTAAGVVQAIGTQFNVYARAEGTDVAVLEGRVRLTPRPASNGTASPPEDLKAGEQAWISADGSVRRAARADVERATAWSKRRLKFDETPLEDMVREFNRYHRNLQLRLEGVPPDSHHYSGIFDADDPEMLASFLENEPDLIIERHDGEIVIRARANP